MFRQNCRNHTWTAFYSTLQLQWTLYSILFTFFLLSNSANSSRCLSVLLSSDSSKYSPVYRNPETMSGMEWHFKDMVSYSTVHSYTLYILQTQVLQVKCENSHLTLVCVCVQLNGEMTEIESGNTKTQNHQNKALDQ